MLSREAHLPGRRARAFRRPNRSSRVIHDLKNTVPDLITGKSVGSMYLHATISGSSPARIIVKKRRYGTVVPGRAPQSEPAHHIIVALKVDATRLGNRCGFRRRRPSFFPTGRRDFRSKSFGRLFGGRSPLCAVLMRPCHTGRARFNRRNRLVPVRALLPQLPASPAIAVRLRFGLRTATSAARCARLEIQARRGVLPSCPY